MSKKVAVLFPGQGSQYPELSKEIIESELPSRAYFERLPELVGKEKAKLIREGRIEDLSKTKNAQVAIFLNSVCLFDEFMRRYRDTVEVKAASGLSLGEYSALYAAGALEVEEAIRLLDKRGEIMDREAAGKGGMIAVMKSSVEELEEIISELRKETDEVIAVCNLNSPAQIVVGGQFHALELFQQKAGERGLKKLIRLEVEGPFHTELLKKASEEFREVLGETKFKERKLDVYGNYLGTKYAENADLIDLLAKQMYSPVRFEKIIREMIEEGYGEFIEIGPGSALKGFVKKIDKTVKIYNIERLSDIEAFESARAEDGGSDE